MGERRFAGKVKEFLALGRKEQKGYDLRSLFETHPTSYLAARCISPDHRDDTPSMLIYHDAVSCRGCGRFWWPDDFLRELGDRWLETEVVAAGPHGGGTKPSHAVANTFCDWLTDNDGPYTDRLPVMHARGLRRDTLLANHIGHNGEGFSIPVYTETGLETIRFRRDDERSPDRPKYWGTSGHNRPLPYLPFYTEQGRTTRPILVEGELDALRLAQEGYNAVAITNGAQALPRTVRALISELKAMSTEWLLCGDTDRVGIQAMNDVSAEMRLGGIQTGFVSLPPSLGKDVTDFLNHWPVHAFDQYVRRAELCAFASSSVVSTR